MKIGDMFSNDLINAADIGGKRVKLVVDEVRMVEMGNDGPKPAVCFKGSEKMLPLNKTNATALAEAYGDDTEDWAGKPVTLFTRQVEFRGKMVPGVRVAPGHGETEGDGLPF